MAYLLKSKVTPDQVSLASIFFAALAGAAFSAYAQAPALLSVLAALCIQLRLLCNMLDGMLAVEGGRGSKFGAIYNELPDRLADVLIIVGAGIGSAQYAFLGIAMIHWAWLAAVLAVATAYIRSFGASLNGKSRFLGPMAKPHRMALLTGAALLEALLCALGRPMPLLPLALMLMVIGLIVTCVRRIQRIVDDLTLQT